MFLRRLLIALCLLSPLAANAQSSKTDVVSAINVDFADNTAGAITAALLRSVTTQMVSSYVDWLTCTGQGGMAYWNATAAPTCLVSGTAGQVLSTYNTPAWESLASKLAAGTGVTISGTITPTISTSPSAVLDFLGSTQNSILYRGASGWTILPPGTNGQYLRSDSPPFWTSIASAITAGTGIIVTGTITPTIAVSPNAVLDTYGTTQGGVLYRGSTGWAFLSPGTSGQVFTTGGTGANPSYTTVSGTGTVQAVTCGLGLTCSTNPITVTGTISLSSAISPTVLISNGGTSATSLAGAQANLGFPFTMSSIITVDFSVAGDNVLNVQLPTGFTRWRPQIIEISGANGDLSAANFGIFTSAGGAGTAIVSAATAITVTTASEDTNNNLMVISAVNAQNSQSHNQTTIYFRVGSTAPAGRTGKITFVFNLLS